MGLELYMQAFWELGSCRSVGFGEGPIPWGEIAAYATYHRLEEDQETALFHHVRSLDNVYLQHKSKDTSGAKGKRTSISAKAKG